MILAADRAPPLSPLSVVDDDRRRHFRETGKFYGYPPCCVAAFVKTFALEASALRRRNTAHGFVPCQKHARLLESGAIKHADLIADRSPDAPATIEEDEPAPSERDEMEEEFGDEFAAAELLYECSREFDVLADAMPAGTPKQLRYRSLASRCFEAAEILDDDDYVFDQANEAAAFEVQP